MKTKPNLTQQMQTTNAKFEDRREKLLKINTRLSLLMREIDVWNLDVAMFSKSLSEGKMPKGYYKEVYDFLNSSSKELTKIANAWEEIFKEECDVESK